MTGFRTACPRPEKTEENGVRVGRRVGIGTLPAVRVLSRSRDMTVELHPDSEYADGISGVQEKWGQPGR